MFNRPFGTNRTTRDFPGFHPGLLSTVPSGLARRFSAAPEAVFRRTECFHELQGQDNRPHMNCHAGRSTLSRYCALSLATLVLLEATHAHIAATGGRHRYRSRRLSSACTFITCSAGTSPILRPLGRKLRLGHGGSGIFASRGPTLSPRKGGGISTFLTKLWRWHGSTIPRFSLRSASRLPGHLQVPRKSLCIVREGLRHHGLWTTGWTSFEPWLTATGDAFISTKFGMNRNVKRYWSASPEQMVEMTRQAHDIVKGIDPTAIIVGPSPVGENGLVWLSSFLRAGGGRYVDVIGFHFYVFPAPPEAQVPLINSVKAIMRGSDAGDKPLWDTEAGWAKPAPFPLGATGCGLLGKGLPPELGCRCPAVLLVRLGQPWMGLAPDDGGRQ